MTRNELQALIRSVPDFPAPGILFRDVTTLIGHGEGFRAAIHHLSEMARAAGAQAIGGMEARGFIFGAPVAVELGLPFIPLRKQGKLPVPTIGIDYALEYGTDRLELDPTTIQPGANVVIIDDLIATGGTAVTAVKLLRAAGAVVTQALFVIDLVDLQGAARLREQGLSVEALLDFPGH